MLRIATGFRPFHVAGLVPIVLGSLLAMSATMASAQVREITLPVNDLIYDAARQRILASVPSRAGAGLGNTITVINPATGAIGPSVFVGSEPGKLALSDDNRALYVALDGAAAIRRVDAASLVPNLQFGLGSDPFSGPYFAEDLEVLPALPGSVAVSRRYMGVSPRHAGVAVYDDGVMRPEVTSSHTGSNVIEAAQLPGRLYGLNNETTEFGFRRMTVDADGVSVLDTTPGLVDAFFLDMEFEGGRVYFSSGEVIDPELRQLLGTFTLAQPWDAVVRPAADLGRVFFVSGTTLHTFDAATFVPLGAISVPGMEGVGHSLIRVGANGLAFRTTEDQVFLLGSLPAAVAPTLTLALTGCSALCGPGTTFSVNATVTNPSPLPVRVEVKAGVTMPSGTTMNIWAGPVHYETTLSAGMTATVELLRATLPAGLEAGNWTYEASLLTPDLGHVLSRDVVAFTISP